MYKWSAELSYIRSCGELWHGEETEEYDATEEEEEAEKEEDKNKIRIKTRNKMKKKQ